MFSSRNPFGNTVNKSGKALEKSNFAHTCNLLSQYVKERGTLRDINLAAGISTKSEARAKPEEPKATATTLNLFNIIENPCQPSSQQEKSAYPFSRSALLLPSSASENATRKATSSMQEAAVEPKRPQMTIFYAGEVIVFDDFPSEKAKEIMLLASGGSSGNGNGNVCGSWKATSNDAEKLSSGDAVASCSKEQAIPVCSTAQKSEKPPQIEANTSDLPIARRSSLHRFLAKRKDRAGARGPYQLHNNNNDRPESSSKNDQEQLELKL